MIKRIAGFLAAFILLIGASAPAKSSPAVGERVYFGRFPQRSVSEEPEPIRWIVLSVNGDEAMLLAEQPLAGMPYNDEDHYQYEVTWETCTLRGWLNGEFFQEAFSPEESQYILNTTVKTADYSQNGFTVSGGNPTMDKIFLLSVEEAGSLLTLKDRVCSPTPYAIKMGVSNSWGSYFDDSMQVDTYYSDVSIWWLRSPGCIGHYTAQCNYNGNILASGQYAGGHVEMDTGKLYRIIML